MTKTKVFLILTGLTLLVYIWSLGNPFIWDDEQFIQKNAYITNLKFIPEIFTTNTIAGAGHTSNYYRPLTTLSFLIDYHLWGLYSFGFHLTNVLLHLACGLLLFAVLVRLKMSQIPALIVALIFLLHPVQTEAVTYINSRGDSLYVFWFLVALLSFIYSYQKRVINFGLLGKIRQINSVGLLVISWICYLFSILSKEIAIGLVPVFGVLIMLEVTLNNQKLKQFKAQLLFLGAIFITILIYLSLRLTVLNFGDSLNFYGYENIYTQNLGIRLMTFSLAWWNYLGILFWPFPLHMERTIEITTNFWSMSVLGLIFLGIGLISLTWKYFRKSYWLILGMAVTIGSMVPISGIVPINGLIYEHWLYLPLVGIMLIIYGTYQLLGFNFKFNKSILVTVFVIIVTILCLLTIYQNYLWGDKIRFYEYTLKHAQSARLHNNLAMAYSEVGQFNQAIDEYQKAINLTDAYPQTHHNLANIYFDQRKYQEAAAEYLNALKIEPDFYFSYPKLILSYIELKQLQEAKIYLDKLNQLAVQDPGVKYLNQLYHAAEKASSSNNLPIAK